MKERQIAVVQPVVEGKGARNTVVGIPETLCEFPKWVVVPTFQGICEKILYRLRIRDSVQPKA